MQPSRMPRRRSARWLNLQANGADSYSIKVPITDNGQKEFFWLSDISYADGKFSGTTTTTWSWSTT